MVICWLSGCSEEAFHCTEDAQCVSAGASGTCEQVGYCSFPDLECVSGSRFSHYSAGSIADVCVDRSGELPTDGGSLETGAEAAKRDGESDRPVENTQADSSNETTEGSDASFHDVGNESFADQTPAPETGAKDASLGDAPVGTIPDASPLPPGALAIWNFDEGSGTVTVNQAGGGNDITLFRSAGWTSGITGSALSLATPSYAAAPSNVVDTSMPFSVSAWTKVSALDIYQTLVSVDGNVSRAFNLRYDSDVGRFAILLSAIDGTDPPETRAGALAAPTPNRWYHLVGIYDGTSIKLYVDGVLQSTVAFSSAWKATGALQIGRAKWDMYEGNYLTGAIDQVRLYQRVLSDSEVDALYKSKL